MTRPTTPKLLLIFACLLIDIHALRADEPEVTIQRNTLIFPAGSDQLAAFNVQPAAPSPARTLQLHGRMTWNDNTTARIFTAFGGHVIKVHKDIDEPVDEGTPLADIASPDYGQAQSDAARAESDYSLAVRNYERLSDLDKHGAAAKKDLQAAKSDLEKADAERRRTSARLALYGAPANQANRMIDEVYVLKSPTRGVVVDRNVSAGQEVRCDQMLANAPQYFAPLFVVANPDEMWVQIDVGEADLQYVGPGTRFTIHSSAYKDRTFAGHVEKVTNFLDPISHTIKLRGVVDNTGRLLKADMLVSADFQIGEPRQDSVSVPSSAVFLRDGKYYVFKEEQPGRYTRQEVRMGSEDSEHMTITDGLRAGERVVVNGFTTLQKLLDSASES